MTKVEMESVVMIEAVLRALPDEESRRTVLRKVMENRCPKCFDHDPNGQFWCCYESRGD